MAKEKSLLATYMSATTSKKIDILIDHYGDFMGIIDGYTEGLRYRIQSDKDCKRRNEMGNLGVRVQGGGIKSDPTANMAISNIVTREAIVNCDFSGDIFEDVDDLEFYAREAYTLKQMRMDYELLVSQLGIFGKYRKAYVQYLEGNFCVVDLTTEWGMSYEAAKTKIKRFRKTLKDQMLNFMDRKIEEVA